MSASERNNTASVSGSMRVHPTTIYRLLWQKRIPAVHVRSEWRFNIESIDRWRLELRDLSIGRAPVWAGRSVNRWLRQNGSERL